MRCTLFCTQGTCILIRTKKKQRRKILLSCTAFHHLLFSLFSSPYPCSCSFFFSSSFRISCTIFCATSQSCISDLVLRYSNLFRRISGEKKSLDPFSFSKNEPRLYVNQSSMCSSFDGKIGLHLLLLSTSNLTHKRSKWACPPVI